MLSRHVWCRASTGELFVARRRRLATGAAQLRSDTVSATSEADASARRAKPRANKMAKTGRNAVVSAVFSLRGGALNCRRCSLRECCLLRGNPRAARNASQRTSLGAARTPKTPGRAKSRGIMLREPKTPASNTTPPKALPAAQRDASGAARTGSWARPPRLRPCPGILAKTASDVRSRFRDAAEGVNSCKRRSDNALNELQQR